MSRIALDLSKFKHIKSDKNSTTLRHTNGHELTLSHAGLTPDFKAQLGALSGQAKQAETPLETDELKHKMADGGDVKTPGPADPTPARKEESAHMRQGQPSEQTQTLMNPSKMIQNVKDAFKAEGGEIEQYAQGGNAGEQRKKIFGTNSAPSKPEMKEKHMEHIKNFAKSFLHTSVNPSGGKINPKTGERRDENPEQGVDKPDWRSGKLESQSNPDAMMHELAHLVLLPKGVGLKQGQTMMDKQYADVQKKYGYMQQKKSQGEVQPMAAEQILRRHLGLPAAKNSVPVKEGEGPRTSVEDPNTVIGTRVQKGNKTVDLIRQARNLTPENRERLEHVMTGKLKFHPEHGWQENPEAMGAKTRLYKEEQAHQEQQKGRNEGFAEGGEVCPEDIPPYSEKNNPKIQESKKELPRQKFAEGDPDIGGVNTAIQGQPGPWASGYQQDPGTAPGLEEELRSNVDNSMYGLPSAEYVGKALGHVINTARQGAKAVGQVATETGKGMSAGLKSTGNDISGNDEIQQAPPTTTQDASTQTPATTQGPSSGLSNDAMSQLKNAGNTIGNNAPANPPATPAAPGLAAPGPATMQPTINSAVQNAATGANQAIDAANAEGKSAGEVAQARADVSNTGANRLLDAQAKFENNMNSWNNERMAHIQDMQNGMIDPEQYWQNHSKIATGIGMILAGFNPTNNPNAAINFLKFQMEQNLDAQKTNLGAKNNILAHTMAQFGNIKEAANMARVYQNDALAQQILGANPQAQNDMQRAALQKAAGMLQQDSAAKIYQMAKDRQFFDLMKQGPSGDENAFAARNRAMNYYSPEQANYEAQHHIPGGTNTSIPIEPADRQRMNEHQILDTMLNNYKNYSNQYKDNWMNLNPVTRLQIQNKGASMGKELQSVLGRTLDMGESAQSKKDLEDMLPSNPTKFLPSVAVEPRVNGFIEQNRSRLNGLRNKYALPPVATPQAAEEIKTMGGIKYKKVPGGWQKAQ